MHADSHPCNRGAAGAQRTTITPSRASATETENLEFTVGGSWRYDAEIEFFTEDITATEGDDNHGIDSWVFWVKGSNDVRTSPECEFGAAKPTKNAVIAHYSDDDDEQNETYRLVARVLRWETGRMTATAYALSGGLALTPTIEVGVR